MSTTGSNRRLRALLTGIEDGSLVPRPDFQRRLVWTNKDKSRFLETVLLSLPFPEIYIAAGDVDVISARGSELLVDGQQRISTLYQYFTGSSDLKLNDLVPPYDELNIEAKTKFLEYSVVVRDLGRMDMDDIRQIFERINATAYSLNAMEVHNARFNGEFKQFGEEIADEAFWEQHRVFSQNEIRRMADLRFVLTIVITCMSNYFNRDSELERYLENYNDSFDARPDLGRELRETFRVIEAFGLPEKGRWWKRSDLFSLLVEVHRAVFRTGLEIDPKSVGQRLRQFYGVVDSESEGDEEPSISSEARVYARAALQATNDRSSRVSRGAILAKVLSGGLEGADEPDLEEVGEEDALH